MRRRKPLEVAGGRRKSLEVWPGSALPRAPIANLGDEEADDRPDEAKHQDLVRRVDDVLVVVLVVLVVELVGGGGGDGDGVGGEGGGGRGESCSGWWLGSKLRRVVDIGRR